MSNLRIVPVTLEEAKAFVRAWHRHHGPPAGARFCLGVSNGVLRGVAIAGPPTNRISDDGLTLEVTRVATDGTPNRQRGSSGKRPPTDLRPVGLGTPVPLQSSTSLITLRIVEGGEQHGEYQHPGV